MIAAAAGVAAGLGVAMPLGAISALLMREGLVNGVKVGFAAAAGVASVDAAYCSVAVLAGAALSPAIAGHRDAFLLVSGLVLIGIGVRQMLLARRDRTGATAEVATRSPLGAFARFVALTAINPLTLIYFAALASVVTADGASAPARVAFVAAVAVSSLAWQLLLAGGGSFIGARSSPKAVHTLGVIASLVITGLGCTIVAGSMH